jgi:type VI secretion system secreted protein Hcp
VEGNDQRDYFLKIDGIEGESQDSKHPNEIRIEDFTLNVVNRGRRGDYGVGKPFHDDARFVAYVEQSYPKVKQACAKGDPVPKAVLTCRKAGKNQQDYLRITFSDLFITSCKLDTDREALPRMEFTISFAKKQIEYKEQKQDGSLSGAITAMVDLYGKRSGA